MDYGHDIRFGAFITPRLDRAPQIVELAVASEAAGLDLVTFQDHPYQPAFLDAWTLLSFVAARTEHVSLSLNVANLPLRPPAVLARAAASLDHLTGGRVELGLGAGAFWDAIEAMGGPRRSPGRSVDALTEAIEVIRGVWGRGSNRIASEHYSLSGAKPAAAAHDIGIWLGAYKPRMLRLTGRTADGWLPSLGRMSAQQIVDANARIDDAAVAAGRSPGDVLRLANVDGGITRDTVARTVDELTELALEHGFSTFIFATDDAHALPLIGQEVAPEVRRRIADERRRID